MIGKGGSATVFRGITQDGKLFAIKRLDSFSLQTEREFQNELQILGGLRSPFLVTLLGYCVEKTKRLLVYEYMPNKSLQESLFGVGSSEDGGANLSLNWQRRFNVILDVARALEFLHFGCDPPVIHGDIKPSNVLLQSDFRAKLSDFGLSRIKVEGEFGMDLFSQELSGNSALGDHTPPAAMGIRTPPVPLGSSSIHTNNTNNEVDFALALQASSSSKKNVYSLNLNPLHYNSSTSIACDADCKSSVSAKGKEINGGDDWNDDEFCSPENNSKELRCSSNLVTDEEETASKKQWGKDWWWRQDGSGELCSKDYVMEWIGSQICPSTNPDWDDDDDESKKTNPEKNDLEKLEHVHEPQLQEVHSKKKESKGRKKQNKRHRKMQEWWKEEHLAEMSRKTSKVKKGFKVSRYAINKLFHLHKRNKFGGHNQDDCNANGEFSFRRGWKRKNKNCNGSDMWSGDLFSRELSSSTSMRGTLCYVAPEYGGCGYLMEKADIYSFGVLILVIVSGRRPLHVLASPMKLEKANLITWSRHLAQSGNILELVDEKLKDEYNKEQGSLCINLALSCLQKIPELRPDISEIIKILRGEMDLPPLPMEFSPSPPSKLYSRSRSMSRSWVKEKANAE